VKADVMLSRLLALRRLSEKRALEMLVSRQGECRRAQRAVEEAASDATRHWLETATHERQQIEAFARQPVPAAAIRRFREQVDALVEEQKRLRAVGDTARKALQECQHALDEARASLRLRERAVAKLDHLAQQQSALSARREAADAEAADEERSRGRPPLPAPDTR
jgi:hypothetical protein